MWRWGRRIRDGRWRRSRGGSFFLSLSFFLSFFLRALCVLCGAPSWVSLLRVLCGHSANSVVNPSSTGNERTMNEL